MSRALRRIAQRWWAEGRRAEVVEVVRSLGSVPREAGTRMLVSADEVVGTIGGGHLEWQAIDRARQRLQAIDTDAQEISVALGPTLGQCCGGALTLRFATLNADLLSAWPTAEPRFHLQLYGAGHVGQAIIHALQGIDAHVRWIDVREEAFESLHLPAGDELSRALTLETVWADPMTDEVDVAPPGGFHLVLTHSHDLDLALAERILRRGQHGFFGLIGSATKRARFEHRLRYKGLAPELLSTMTCPIGLPGIEGKEPAVIAVAVVAQLLSRSAPHESR